MSEEYLTKPNINHQKEGWEYQAVNRAAIAARTMRVAKLLKLLESDLKLSDIGNKERRAELCSLLSDLMGQLAVRIKNEN